MHPPLPRSLCAALLLSPAIGGELMTDFTATGGTAPAGWVFDTSGTYSDAALRLEGGNSVTTARYNGAVTSLVLTVRGYSVGTSGSDIALYASTNGTDFLPDETAAFPVPSSRTSQPLFFPPSRRLTRFRLLYRKVSGNAALYSLSAYYDDNALGRRPPLIAPFSPQTLRIGGTLSLPVSVSPTDGDAVTATNLASSTASGPSSLSAGTFTYTPAATDFGTQTFGFTATDADGTSPPEYLTVQVLNPSLPAIPMLQPSGSYSQDFSGLASPGPSPGLWDNGASPLPAWHAWAGTNAVTSYRAGSSPAASGLWAVQGPALVSLPASLAALRYGFALSNATASVLARLTVSFTSFALPAADTPARALPLLYRVTASPLPFPQGSWRRCSALSLCPCAAAADLPDALPPGAVLSLCWLNRKDDGAAAGIRSVSVTWQPGEPPPADAVPLPLSGASQDFDSVPDIPGASLPPGWRVDTMEPAHATRPYALSGDSLGHAFLGDALSFLDVPNGATAFDSARLLDTAVGGVPENDTSSVTILAAFRNVSAVPYRGLAVRYSVEKYMDGTVPTEVELLLSCAGAPWREAAETVFAGDGDSAPVARAGAPSETRAVAVDVRLPGPVPPGGLFWLGWRVTPVGNPSGQRRQALAVDDVEVVPLPETATRLFIR